jgi:hypothetical protein
LAGGGRPVKPGSPRPEDATSFEEFMQRVARERSSSMLRGVSLRSRLLWVVAVICGPLAWAFVLVLLKSTVLALWEWVCAVTFSGVFISTASFLAWRGIRTRRREVQLDGLVEEWRVRASIPPPEPTPRPSPTDFMTAGVGAIGAGAAAFFVAVTAAAFGAPSGFAVALIVIMPTCALVGFILVAIGAARLQKELDRTVAKYGKR